MKLALVTSFIKSQRIQWLGHMKREEAVTVRAALVEWKRRGKRKPKKRWVDVVDMKTLGVEDWRKAVQNREWW